MDVKSPTMGCSRHLGYQAVVATILVLGAYYIQWLYPLPDVVSANSMSSNYGWQLTSSYPISNWNISQIVWPDQYEEEIAEEEIAEEEIATDGGRSYHWAGDNAKSLRILKKSIQRYFGCSMLCCPEVGITRGRCIRLTIYTYCWLKPRLMRCSFLDMFIYRVHQACLLRIFLKLTFVHHKYFLHCNIQNDPLINKLAVR